MRKTKLYAIMLAAVVCTASFAGCGADTPADNSNVGQQEPNSEADGADVSDAQETEGSGYLFEVNGVSLGVDMDADELRAGLGEEKSVFEAPSCASQGTAYIYDYGSYEVETYPEGDKNLIAFITLKDDTVATAEGVDLSMTRDDIISAYGEDYTEKDNGLSYTKDGMKLNFIFDGDDMISIEYVSPAVG